MTRLTIASVALAAVGCASPNLNTLRTRAAYDLSCPEPQLKLTQLSNEVYGVSGCNKKATYVNSPRNWDDWLLNSDSVNEQGRSK